jgi:hypothetical protein
LFKKLPEKEGQEHFISQRRKTNFDDDGNEYEEENNSDDRPGSEGSEEMSDHDYDEESSSDSLPETDMPEKNDPDYLLNSTELEMKRLLTEKKLSCLQRTLIKWRKVYGNKYILELFPAVK